MIASKAQKNHVDFSQSLKKTFAGSNVCGDIRAGVGEWKRKLLGGARDELYALHDDATWLAVLLVDHDEVDRNPLQTCTLEALLIRFLNLFENFVRHL